MIRFDRRGPTAQSGANILEAQPVFAIRPLRRHDWPKVEALFGDRGACGGCWCMYWSASGSGAEWNERKGRRNRESLRALVNSGKCRAMLALVDEQPVGWCRFGPISDFSRLGRSRLLSRPGMSDWAIVCLFVKRVMRLRGLATALAAAAADSAFAAGARSIEGYAVLPRADRVPDAFAWTGVPSIFKRAGFEPVQPDAGARRIYVKRNCRPKGPALEERERAI